jgi:hypothetical protein
VIENQHRCAARLDQLQLSDDLRGILLFFHLFIDKPLQQHLRGIVFLLERQFIKRVDQIGQFGFVRLCLPEDIKASSSHTISPQAFDKLLTLLCYHQTRLSVRQPTLIKKGGEIRIMKKKLPKIVWGLLTALVLAGILGATVVYAQDATPPTPPAGPDVGGPPHGGRGLGPAELEAAAGVLGLTTDELSTQIQNGKTLEDLAAQAGVDVQAVNDAISVAHNESMRQWIEQGVTDGSLSQEKADWLREGLDKGFLDGPGFGFRFGPGPGGPQPNNPPSNSSQ